MQLQRENRALSLAASVLLVALTQSSAGQELVENGYVTRTDKEFTVEGIANSGPIFVPPSLDEVTQYVTHMGYSMKIQRFYAYQSMKGWKTGTGAMIEDWRAAIDSWMTWEHTNPDSIKKAEEVWKTG
jgi:hypothetical protein